MSDDNAALSRVSVHIPPKTCPDCQHHVMHIEKVEVDYRCHECWGADSYHLDDESDGYEPFVASRGPEVEMDIHADCRAELTRLRAHHDEERDELRDEIDRLKRERDEHRDRAEAAGNLHANAEKLLAAAQADLADVQAEAERLRQAVRRAEDDAAAVTGVVEMVTSMVEDPTNGGDLLDKLKNYKADHDWYREAFDKAIEQRNAAERIAETYRAVVEAAHVLRVSADISSGATSVGARNRLWAQLDAVDALPAAGEQTADGRGETSVEVHPREQWAVACPTCGMPAGKACVDAAGELPARFNHQARAELYAASRAQAGEEVA